MELKIKDKIVLIDDDDFDLVRPFTWTILRNKLYADYAISYLWVDGKTKSLLMHRLITGAENGFVVDHKNSNGLDNRRGNLRVVTSFNNAQNSKFRSHNTTGVRNVKVDVRPNGSYALRGQVTAFKKVHRKWFLNMADAKAWVEETRKRLHGDFIYIEDADARNALFLSGRDRKA